MRVELEFESPLIVGNKRLTTNYIESKDYISGSVIRAAIARNILNHCEAYHGEVEEIPNPQILKKRKRTGSIIVGKRLVKLVNMLLYVRSLGSQ